MEPTYTITNIHRSEATFRIYASVVDQDGKIRIRASLSYCVQWLEGNI